MQRAGSLRVAEKRGADWQVNQWAKKAVLLSFRLTDMYEISGSNGGSNWWDKVPSKWQGWTSEDWKAAATFHKESWWPRWKDWLATRSGKQIKARVPGDSVADVLAPAPGTYVTTVPTS